MPHAHTEGQRVGQPAIGLFTELGWETKGEVVLVPRLRAALEPLNPTLPAEAFATTESNWTPLLDPYWTHTRLITDPSADQSA